MSTLEHIQQGHWIAALSIMSFSFFAGWSIGFATKALFKILLLVCGVIIAAIIALQYAEVIPTVDWGRVSELFKSASAATRESGTNLFNFAKQTLPSTATFIAGAWFAWRRH